MIVRIVVVLALLITSLRVNALSPQAEELISLNNKLAAVDCRTIRDSLEALIASFVSAPTNPTYYDRLDKLNEQLKNLPPEILALEKRRKELLRDNDNVSDLDMDAVVKAREATKVHCPWYHLKSNLHDPPPAWTAEDAKRYVIIAVPVMLMKWRICEVVDPQHKGELEKSWAASPFSRLDLPELQSAVQEVRAWMKDGYDTLHPESAAAQEMREKKGSYCTNPALGKWLKRIESALPAGFLNK